MTDPDQSLESSPTPARFRRWIAAALIGYWILIFTLTHVPVHTEGLPRHSDKLAHILMYSGLGFLLAAWFYLRGSCGWRLFAIVIAIASGYGILDELLQIPVGRHADIIDWLADTVGALVGYSYFLVAKSILSKRSRK